MSWEASDGRWPSCLTRISHTISRSPSASGAAGLPVTGSAGAPSRASANLATLAWSWATMFLAFCGPMPGSARRYFSSWRAIAAASSPTGAASARAAIIGPDVLHRDQLLEELLVEIRREADEDRARLVARGVVVDDERQLAGLVAGLGGGALERAQRDRRQEHLVADAAALHHDAILEPAPQAPGQRGDHAEPAPQARQPGQGERQRVGDVRGPRQPTASPSSRCTPSWIWALEACAVGGDGALDLGGRQRHDGDVALARGQADHAAGVGHQERGARELVLRVEIFQRHQRGRVLGEDVGDRVEDLMDADVQRSVGAGGDDAGVDDDRAARRPARRAPSRYRRARDRCPGPARRPRRREPRGQAAEMASRTSSGMS